MNSTAPKEPSDSYERNFNSHSNDRQEIVAMVHRPERPDDRDRRTCHRAALGGWNRGHGIFRLAVCLQRPHAPRVRLAHTGYWLALVGVAGGRCIRCCRYVFAAEPGHGHGVSDTRSGYLSLRGRLARIHLGLPAPSHAGLGLAVRRWRDHPAAGGLDLANLARGFCMGARHAAGNKHAVQRHGSSDDFTGSTPLGDRFDLAARGTRTVVEAYMTAAGQAKSQVNRTQSSPSCSARRTGTQPSISIGLIIQSFSLMSPEKTGVGATWTK